MEQMHIGQWPTRGERARNWAGGKHQDTRGYVRVYVDRTDPYHVMADYANYAFEHRLIVARHLGRPLKFDEVVHHINGDKADNRLENLQLLNRDEHDTSYCAGYLVGFAAGFQAALDILLVTKSCTS